MILYSKARYIKTIELAEGNIGALQVLFYNPELVSVCQKYNCRGAKIWEVYTEVVKGNVKEFERVVSKGGR